MSIQEILTKVDTQRRVNAQSERQRPTITPGAFTILPRVEGAVNIRDTT